MISTLCCEKCVIHDMKMHNNFMFATNIMSAKVLSTTIGLFYVRFPHSDQDFSL